MTPFAAALLGACAFAAEVMLWRTFSAVVPYHVAFLLVLACPLGLAIGAALAGLWGVSPGDDGGDRADSIAGMVVAACFLVAPPCLVRVGFTLSPFDAGAVMRLLAAAGLAGAPFVALGNVQARLLRRSRFTPLLAAQLLGAAAGAWGSLVALELAPAPTLLFGLAVPAALAATFCARRDALARRGGAALTALAAGLLAASRGSALLYLPPHVGGESGSRLLPVFERWTPTARVLGYVLAADAPYAAIFADRLWLPVPVVPAQGPAGTGALMTGAASIAYTLGAPGRALIVGGGARDVQTALEAGQRAIDVIAFERTVIGVSEEVLASRTNLRAYSRPGVSLRVGSPRALVARGDTTYDYIQLPFAVTFGGDPAFPFFLRENDLYTVEGFDELLGRLSPRGVLAVSQPVEGAGEDALRATVLALAALGRRGVADPARHVMVVLGSHFFDSLYATVFLRRQAFSDAEIRQIETLALDRAEGLAFAPGGPNYGAWQALAESASPARFCADRAVDVCPPTDDRPFFFQATRLRHFLRNSAAALYPVDPLWSALFAATLAALLGLAAVILPGGGVALSARASVLLSASGAALLAVAVLGRAIPLLGLAVGSLAVIVPLALCAAAGGVLLSPIDSTRSAGAPAHWSDPAWAIALVSAAAIYFLPFPAFPVARWAAVGCLVVPNGIVLGRSLLRALTELDGAVPPRAVAIAWIGAFAGWGAGTLLAVRFGLTCTALAACLCLLAARGAIRKSSSHHDFMTS